MVLAGTLEKSPTGGIYAAKIVARVQIILFLFGLAATLIAGTLALRLDRSHVVERRWVDAVTFPPCPTLKPSRKLSSSSVNEERWELAFFDVVAVGRGAHVWHR